MPRDLRNEREFSFHGCGCSLGLPVCSCATACERPERDESSDGSWFWAHGVIALIGVGSLAAWACGVFQ